jgi:hypothetical protein
MPKKYENLQCSEFVKFHLQHSFHSGSGVHVGSPILENVAVNDVTFQMHCQLLPHFNFTQCEAVLCLVCSLQSGSTWI